jgi:hypothetical protein
LLNQFLDMKSDMRFKFQHVLHWVYGWNNFSLACMLSSISSVEDTSINGCESVVEIAFQRPISMSIHRMQSVGVSDRNMVRGNANKFPWILVRKSDDARRMLRTVLHM